MMKHALSSHINTKKRLYGIVMIVLLSLAAAELSARLFWKIAYGVPMFAPSRILLAFYPEMKRVCEILPSHDDDKFDILILAGSVMHPEWGQTEKILLGELRRNGYDNVRIFNLAVPAHTTRDSLLKYAALDSARFDLVVIYHGLNEVRANNVPPSLWHDNYDHYSWYQSVNVLASYRNTYVALPHTVHYLGISAWQRFHGDRYVPTHFPRHDWIQYGNEPRSVDSLGRNIDAMLDIAASRKDRVLLLTFAVYVPENYSQSHFFKGELDYALPLVPVETWGARDHVLKTVALHNERIRVSAAARPEVALVDFARRLPGSGRYFADPCHLTYEGSAMLAGEILSVIARSGISR